LEGHACRKTAHSGDLLLLPVQASNHMHVVAVVAVVAVVVVAAAASEMFMPSRGNSSSNDYCTNAAAEQLYTFAGCDGACYQLRQQ